jgi:endonuclease/exonuclease/phosphatase family metal-dependent hydrolase
MRLVTFNVLSGRSPDDATADLDAFAAEIGSLDADVLALQEVDLGQPRSGNADLTAVAAEAMGAVAHRFVPALSGTPGERWRPAEDGDEAVAPAYGVALLSRLPVTHWRTVRLPRLPVRSPWWWHGAGWPTLVREEPRVAVVARIATPEGPLTVVNTHLSFLPWWNGWQLHHLVGSLAEEPRPLVLAGDLNLGPVRATTLTGMTSLAAHPTFPADAPTRQIDHVLAAGQVRAASSYAPRVAVSDHRPLVVALAR